MNERARKLFPRGREGDICFEAFRNRHNPCTDCPWHPESGEELNQEVIYSQRLDRWYEILSLEIEWPGHGPCVLFSSQEIDEGSKNLFFALTKEAAYDELFEIDLARNNYQVLYSEQGLFAAPPSTGPIDNMLDDILESLVHPDDRARFVEFWDITTILTRITQAGGTLQDRFRRKTASGLWGWTTQTVIPVKRGAGNEPVLMCFISQVNDDWIGDAALPREDALVKQLEGLDPLTATYNSGTFMRKATELAAVDPSKPYEFLYIDIENFKVFNEWFGRDAGDRLLKAIAEHLKQLAASHGGITGYLGGDDFVALLPYGTAESVDLENALKTISSPADRGIGFQPAIGACFAQGGAIPMRTICDHAMTAALSIKGNYAKRCVWYEQGMTQRLEEDPKILIEVQRALENREFVLYWQPQCNTRTGKIVGVEALVRWNHPERGLVGPADFIPILERNGFIASLDLYVWEEACRLIKGWIDRGETPIPACVNISRGDLYSIDIVESITELVDSYGLDRSVLHLEITESAYAEDEKMIEAVSAFKERGFSVFIDDFGSGYSSLNILREIKADVVKIDMKFLDLSQDELNRGESILESIVTMTHLMELSVVAEGAETKEQVDFLKDIGCTYAQGYYFYRPLPTDELERLLANKDLVDYRGINFQPVEIIEIHDIFKNDLASRSIIDNVVGAMAVYALSDDGFELLQVNKQYYRVTQCDPSDMAKMRAGILDYVHPDDRRQLLELFKQAERHAVSGALGTFRRLTAAGDTIWIRIKTFHLRNEGNRKLFYATLLDVTRDKLQEEALRASQKALEEVMGIHVSDQAIGDITAENQQIAAQVFSQTAPSGLIGGYCEEDFPIFFANNEMVRMLGCDSYADLVDAIGGKVINTIHPDDRESVASDIGPEYYEGLEYNTQYRLVRKDKSWTWVADRGRVVRTESGRLAIASVCIDISETVRMQTELELEDRLLKSVVEQADLNVWLYDIETNSLMFKNISSESLAARFLASNGLLEHNETAAIDLDEALATSTFSSDSREKLAAMFSGLSRGIDSECEILVDFKSGDQRWVKISCEVVYGSDGSPAKAIGYLEDIDETKRRVLDLKTRADRDSLTGLLNRSAGSRAIKRALAAAKEESGSGAFIILDLDDFKHINDQFGHIVGDKALSEIAQSIKKFFRKDDVVSRWGGDEFIAYCSGLEKAGAERKANDICTTAFSIDTPDGEQVNLSVSAGIALVPDEGGEINELYRCADAALYKAKANGKSQFAISESQI